MAGVAEAAAEVAPGARFGPEDDQQLASFQYFSMIFNDFQGRFEFWQRVSARYEIGKQLGHGAASQVFACRRAWVDKVLGDAM